MAPAAEIIQRAINSIDEGAGRTAIRYLVVLVLAVALFTAFALARFHGLTDPAAMDHAQIARNMAEGRGYATSCLRPVDTGVPVVARPAVSTPRHSSTRGENERSFPLARHLATTVLDGTRRLPWENSDPPKFAITSTRLPKTVF